jgi:hypothetical protein
MPSGIKLNINKDLLEEKYIYERLNLNILANFFFTDRNTISRYLKKYNIPRRNNSRYSFNEYFFDSPNIANCYWAGFIAADGCIANKKGKNGVNYLSIGLSIKDKKHLEIFKNDIKFSGPITIDKKNICRLRIFSQKICDDLYKNFNISQRKTNTLEPPINLTDEQIIAFFAGFVDGDGCICLVRGMPTLSLIGTKEILEWIKKELRRILNLEGSLGIYKTQNFKTKVWYYDLNIYTYKDLIKIYNRIEKLNIFIMNRKWDKIKEWKTRNQVEAEKQQNENTGN